MLRLFHRDDDPLDAGARARARHAAWLTRALASPPGALPRIPLRRVSDGGFAGLMRTVEGRAWADRWWEIAWSRLDDDGV